MVFGGFILRKRSYNYDCSSMKLGFLTATTLHWGSIAGSSAVFTVASTFRLFRRFVGFLATGLGVSTS